ncbi:MAG: iron ABC transporter permease [Actinomycetota bacterium]
MTTTDPSATTDEPLTRSGSVRRALMVGLVIVVIIVVLAAYNLTQGEPDTSFGSVIDALLRTDANRDDISEFLVREVRYPRILIALMAGASLGLAGVLLQDSLRNPLADPALLGVAQGVGLIVSINAIYPEVVPPVPITVLCMIGGTLAGALVLWLSRNARDTVRVVLSGAMLSILFGTITTAIVLLAPQTRSFGVIEYYRFVIGALDTVNWGDVRLVLPWFVIAAPFAFGASRVLNLLQLGDETAAGLGLDPGRTRLWLMLLSMALVTPFVAVIGPIGFVSLFAPHISRSLLASNDARLVLAISAVNGALLLLVADTAGRLLFFPTEVPAGVFTWLIVGPLALVIVGRLGRGRAT